MTEQYVKGLPYRMTPFAIFDLDGTLIDSMSLWEEIDRSMLTARGVAYDRDALTEATKTMNVAEAMSYWISAFGLTDTLEELSEEVERRADEAYSTAVPLKHNAMELLDHFRAQGVHMCVATSSGISQVEKVMRRLGIWDKFDFVLTAGEVGRGKDFPDIYLEAARRLGGTPENTTVFEDTLAAVHTAKSAGFKVVAVYDDSGKSTIAQTSRESDCFVRDLGQLL